MISRRDFLTSVAAMPLLSHADPSYMFAPPTPNRQGLVTAGMPIGRHVIAVVVDGVYHPAEDCLAADDREGWLLRWVVTLNARGQRELHGPRQAPRPGCPVCDRRWPSRLNMYAQRIRERGALHKEIVDGVVRFAFVPPSVEWHQFAEYVELLVNGQRVTKTAFIGALRSLQGAGRSADADLHRRLVTAIHLDEREVLV